MAQKLSKKQIEQYEHDKQERANIPHVGLVTPASDPDTGAKKKYEYDPHLDPQLQWAGKAEHTSFEVPTVSLHVHERIDPKTIIESVKKEKDNGGQLSLFSEKKPLREAIDFYKHKEGWANRLIAGDSLLVMNSLLEKEGMAGKVQMVFFDPPYGISYRSNFQPFVSQRDVKDTDQDKDLNLEPEMLKAFRDTWELGIHSYLAYLKDRLILARELMADNGSIFIQIGNENVHLVRNILDEVFGPNNFYSQISFRKKMMPLSKKPGCESMNDYLLWYAKDKESAYQKVKQLYIHQNPSKNNSIDSVEIPNEGRRNLSSIEKQGISGLPKDWKVYQTMPLKPREYRTNQDFNIEFNGSSFAPMGGKIENTPDGTHCWSTTKDGLERIKKANRLEQSGNYLRYVLFHDDYPVTRLTANWNDTAPATNMKYVVETSLKVIMRCILMSTDPGDLVLDITCGSGATAQEAERLGRRWITCDTSRIALAIAKQKIMTRQFDFYKLAQPQEGISSGLIYSTVPHITSGSIANNHEIDLIWNNYAETLSIALANLNTKLKNGENYGFWNVPWGTDALWSNETILAHKKYIEIFQKYSNEVNKSIQKTAGQEIMYDSPSIDTSRLRITGPFTVEAVPAPYAKSFDELEQDDTGSDTSIARSGETNRQAEWRDELLRAGVRAKGGNIIQFTRVEPLAGTKYIQAEAETKEDLPKKVLVVFGPEHAPLEQRMVENAWQEARSLKPDMLLFCAFQFDEEAAKDIDELTPSIAGMQLIKAQMNADMLTDDLRKKRSSNESFWLVGQPDVRIHKLQDGKIQVEVMGFDYYNPKTGLVESGGKKNIAMWMLDTDYDNRSLFPSQVFFPMAGAGDGWDKLAKNLKAEIDEEKIESFKGTISLPFEAGSAIAVKIIDDRGIESLRVLKI